jgi:hypothetical protein
MVSVLMEIDENENQVLGFVELNGLELYDMLGKPCGMSRPCAYSHCLNKLW